MGTEHNEIVLLGNASDAMRRRQLHEREEAFLHAFFSDETSAFRAPVEPKLGERMTVRLRVEREIEVQATMLVGAGLDRVPMRKVCDDGLFAWYEAEISCGLEPITYRFEIDCDRGRVVYQKGGAHWAEVGPGVQGAGPSEPAAAAGSSRPASKADAQLVAGLPSGLGLSEAASYAASAGSARHEPRLSRHLPAAPAVPERDFRVVPGAHVPAWAQGAVLYQIFPDRFANGEARNDVVDREYAYDGVHVVKVKRWDEPPAEDDYRRFYGGDLQGVLDKLDYLQDLGVEAIYFNPIFIAPSSHKYDTQDYEHIDPHLARIVDDNDSVLAHGDFRNEHARRYIVRTTSPENLASSDAFFARLCEEIHRRGMKIILDGVFNHCGSFSRWLDREGIYKGSWNSEPGAYQSIGSPYRHYFGFEGDSTTNYEGWWDYHTLPKLNYEQAPDLADRIIGIASKWAMPPYSIDGWRLDVAADLGHSEEYNHYFWRRFRDELKRVNPELLIIAEHYGDVSPWLGGDQWDTVMNYDAFMDPLTFFLTGMEKHSDHRRDDLYQDGEAFWATMHACLARFGWESLLCAMNELSNHDHSRFLTRTNRTVGRLHTQGSVAAGEGVDKRVMREAVVVQMTWPGAPTIYYGDEAGQVGWTDPDCRRTYPWGNEDTGLIELHRRLTRLRAEHPALRTGSFMALGGGRGWIAFGRFSGDDRIAVVCNNSEGTARVPLHLRVLGAPDGAEVASLVRTVPEGVGFSMERLVLGTVRSGSCEIAVPAHTALVVSVG